MHAWGREGMETCLVIIRFLPPFPLGANFLGTFIADVIFFIYLYQRYIYRVDPKRLNEFGTSGEMMEQNGEVAGGDQRQITEGESTESEAAVKSVEEKKKD